MKIIDAAYNTIKRRHNDIPQETLPLRDLAAPTAKSLPSLRAKPRGPRSVRWANCPNCLAAKATGIIRLADGSQVFRDHYKTLNSGLRMLCSGSGKVAPEGEE